MSVLTKNGTSAYDTEFAPPAFRAEEIAKKVDGRVKLAWWLVLLAGFGFVGAGGFTVARGYDARNQVRDQLLAENITTPEDASIPNVRVDDDVTAMAQADIIQTHALKTTEGKSYAEMDREDPNRQVAFQASALRTALMSAALAWNTANLAMGVGAFMAGLGLLIVVALVLIRPRSVETA